jgi:hypothetical protein
MRHCFCIFMSLMRKTLIIWFVSIHLLGNTELPQLFKLPNLISHYFEHSRLNPDLSFGEFLVMHYGGDDGTSADDDTDNKLPCHNSNTNTITITYSPMVNDLPSFSFSSWNTREYNSRLQSGISSKNTKPIFQPPRLA